MAERELLECEVFRELPRGLDVFFVTFWNVLVSDPGDMMLLSWSWKYGFVSECGDRRMVSFLCLRFLEAPTSLDCY